MVEAAASIAVEIQLLAIGWLLELLEQKLLQPALRVHCQEKRAMLWAGNSVATHPNPQHSLQGTHARHWID